MHHIISDIHGCFYTLRKLIEKVHDADDSPQFIFVGDYVDRGLHNKEVIDYVIELQSKGAVCLRGNHDDVVDWIISGQCKSKPTEWTYGKPTFDKVVNWWIYNGFGTTLDSYGISDRFDQKEIKEKIPEEHQKFFNGLGMFWECETHFCCHAYMNPYRPLPRTMKFVSSDLYHEMLWSRFSEKTIYHGRLGNLQTAEIQWDKIGVFGHTPTDFYASPVPIKSDKIRLIDTGAFKGSYLTAFCVEAEDWILQLCDPSDMAR